MARSFDRKDLPLDKVTMGLLFHPLKAEVVHQQLIQNQVEAVTGHYVHFHNQERLLSGLGYASPADYERLRP